MKDKIIVKLIVSVLVFVTGHGYAQIPDPNQGLRAAWMRGTYGLNWKPAKSANGKSESPNLVIDHFLEQIKGLKTVDYIQLHLGESATYSSVHIAPHDLLESLWQGDVDSNGKPINLIVPRKSSGVDPFLKMLVATKNAGLKTQVYVNSANMLRSWRVRKGGEVIQLPVPGDLPDVTKRWKHWCDTNPKAQQFIKSKPYHTAIDWPERKYMFCYAEFVLKPYAVRYGDLIDAWLFDAGKTFYQFVGGDNRESGLLEDQRIYQAFSNALHEGNPKAAIAFNNSFGALDRVHKPFSEATLFDDYMFGHPFFGGRNIGAHKENKFLLEWWTDRDGYPHRKDGNDRTWDDNVVGHLDPPMSVWAWNDGTKSGLTNEQFVDWYGPAIAGGGAISLGVPLLDRDSWDQKLLARDWGMEQLVLLDAYLSKHQNPGKPNWARQETVLPPATIGKEYSYTLTEGIHFWDPEGDEIQLSIQKGNQNLPSWLTLTKSSSGEWVLVGIPTEAENIKYQFNLRAEDKESGATDREVVLDVIAK
ncbi:putative Ig domain-containing protein [Wenyingzhuangia sp. 1_MG-2023]|nr:putative Ig domain-containing protein [Wenyingzhuangia sp. 1_MG-2023]